MLVYSAACHRAFPVIFKLDRSSGSCDVISTDWLLNTQQQSASDTKKSGNSLETILASLAARQATRPGFGVRLFVQGCVLSGCDYAPNLLSGVGLVNAFKAVRDNAYRNDNVRLKRILDSVPRKAKAELDMVEYEEILAKSEAVFYYHIVEHMDGSIKPMLEPKLTHETGDVHHHSDHFPCLQRFEDTVSFLGVSKNKSSPRAPGPPALGSARIRTNEPPVPEIIVPQNKEKKKWTSLEKTVKKASNPYSKKRSREESRQPLQDVARNHTRSINTIPNLFSQFARRETQPARKIQPEFQKYRQRKDDVRFVKRRFSVESDRNYQPKTNGARQLVLPISTSFREAAGGQRPSSLSHRSKQAGKSTESVLKTNTTMLPQRNNDVINGFDYETPEDFVPESPGKRFSLDLMDREETILTSHLSTHRAHSIISGNNTSSENVDRLDVFDGHVDDINGAAYASAERNPGFDEIDEPHQHSDFLIGGAYARAERDVALDEIDEPQRHSNYASHGTYTSTEGDVDLDEVVEPQMHDNVASRALYTSVERDLELDQLNEPQMHNNSDSRGTYTSSGQDLDFDQLDEPQTYSKYFGKSKSRRVTLDELKQPANRRSSSSTCFEEDKSTSCRSENFTSESFNGPRSSSSYFHKSVSYDRAFDTRSSSTHGADARRDESIHGTTDMFEQSGPVQPQDNYVDLSSPSYHVRGPQATNRAVLDEGFDKVENNSWGDDDVIESPDSRDPNFRGRIPRSTSTQRHNRIKKQRKRGPLENGFKRQMEFSQKVRPRPRPSFGQTRSRPVSRSQPKAKTIKTFFQPMKLQTDQTEEDFLWNDHTDF